MLLLAAIDHLLPGRALKPDQELVRAQAAIGHVGLTIIALVYVLVIMWRS